MKYLKKLNDDVKDAFNYLSDIKAYHIPYDRLSFNVYVLIGNREETNDHLFLKELYHDIDILRNIYNLDPYHIILTEDEGIIILKEYKSNNRENYLEKLDESLLYKYLPSDVFDKIEPHMANFSTFQNQNKWLSTGINYKNGNSGNLSLFGWRFEN